MFVFFLFMHSNEIVKDDENERRNGKRSTQMLLLLRVFPSSIYLIVGKV